MGKHEQWAQPSGLLPNGLLPNESTSVLRVLDLGRWSKAEERVAELIARIQPNQPSEERRNAVADYVQRLIMKCFPCQVFTFGSVPLKTYLPDGDIDLTAFSKNQTLKDTWASQVRDILQSEEKNENAEFRVKEVQYIQAEVKIIKCLVENIVVDISFNQLGGLCTLCFLEEVDNLINQNHLFKRSIILIKAWCYYESRILGAHHGLISTYALETLVLYIFHVFNNTLTGPLEVLYRFLEFFSHFDWDNFCVSLWGPVPISSLPDVTAESPRKDGGELLLSKLFLEACSTVYAVFPGGQENQGQPFLSKHFNVVDPLRVNNNLGRSVSKGNFFRIRSAFAFGAKRLARLLDCPEENIVFELNQFFMNTWERHGSGVRPDAPSIDLRSLSVRSTNQDDQSNNQENASSSNNTNNTPSTKEIEIDVPQSTRPLSSQRSNYPLESTSKVNDVSANKSKISEQAEKSGSSRLQIDKNQRKLKNEKTVNELQQGKHLFTRTRSSPELTDVYYDISSRTRRNKPTEKTDNNNRRKNVESETCSSHHTLDVGVDSNNLSNSYVENSSVVVNEDHNSVIGAQEEQDLVNLMASTSLNTFGGHIPMPMNLGATRLPLPISQSVLASMGYAPRNMGGLVPANIPLIDPNWANLQFHQGLISSPLTQYFPGVGLSTNPEDVIEQGDENFGSVEMARVGNKYWHEREVGPSGGFGQDEGNSETLSVDDRRPSTSGTSNYVPSSHVASSRGSLKPQSKVNKEHRVSLRDDFVENFQHQEIDDRVSSARFSSASQTGSVRSKTSSDSSWDGSSSRPSRGVKEKRGRKTVPVNVHGKDKNVLDHSTVEFDEENRDLKTGPSIGNEIEERSTTSPLTSTLHVQRHPLPGFESTQSNELDSSLPIPPMIVGPTSCQRVVDNSGVPLKFYPTGPPVPFVTMLPLNYFPSEGETSDPSSTPVHHDNHDNHDPIQNINISKGHETPDVSYPYNTIRTTTTDVSEESKSDVLNSDFASHWQNLQYGRFCQGPRFPGPVICPSSVVVPPMYLQGRFPWDGPGRPIATNMNLVSQLINYSPHIVPVAAPLQPMSTRPSTVYQRYADELPRYRSGTGTYLPNPKPTARDRHSSSSRRNNYNYDRNDHNDREGNWNTAKARAAARNHNRTQTEKPRIDRSSTHESRVDRPWATYRHGPITSNQAQNGQPRPGSSQGSSSSMNMAYSMYPLQNMNPGGLNSNGPSVVMLYPYDHNSGYVSPGEQLEFGSLGPVNVDSNDGSQLGDGSQLRRGFEDQRFHRSSGQQSSPDQPSSPHFHRRI